MISANNITLRFGTRILFNSVNMKFEKGNCYGLIGANGAGKSTFLKILSGEIDSTSGDVTITKGERLSFLKQNHNEYNEFTVIETVVMGNGKLYSIMKEKEAIYMKENFTDEDGIRAGELESEFADMNGWSAESDAAILLSGLGIPNDLHDKKMHELPDKDKVKVLLAQALFGDPDILLLDEPTNGLDDASKIWLEEFLIESKNTVIVVSHDRHFLNKVCTHMVDIDYEKISLFVGNYDFWRESSELIQRQMKDSNKRKEDKIKELQDFIARFSANASKSKQATSRKKSLEKIELDDMKPSSRKYPYINFELERPLGKEVIDLSGITKEVEGSKLLNNINIHVNTTDKIVFLGSELAITTLFKIIMKEIEPDSGTIKYGTTVTTSYFPKDHEEYFNVNSNLIDWLREYSTDKAESFVRGFLGRMLFSGDEALKKVNVLSGGEKVRLMMSKLMLSKGNVLILDEVTNHLDIETITSLNEAMSRYNGAILFGANDHELKQSVANRVIEIKEDGTLIDKYLTYDEYLAWKLNK